MDSTMTDLRSTSTHCTSVSVTTDAVRRSSLKSKGNNLTNFVLKTVYLFYAICKKKFSPES